MKKHFLLNITGAVALCFSITLALGGCNYQNPNTVDVNKYGVSKGAGSVGIHTVLKGDTIYKIAQNYRLPMREIITLNNIEAPYRLNTGFRMKLPPPNEHRVREGDSVELIARMYETSPSQIVSLNDLSAPYRLTSGRMLRIPPKTPPAAAMVQDASFVEDVQTARLELVERGSVTSPNASSATKQNAVVKNSTIVPDKKPQAQQASATTRASLPKTTPKMSGNGKFMQPVDGNIISTFGPKVDGLHNDGINIKAVRGTPVRAAENGVVVYTGDDLEGYGNLILVRHENRMMSAYAHLDKILIERGATVKRGQSIGTVGSTGQVDTPQLHFEIRKGSTALDPAKWL